VYNVPVKGVISVSSQAWKKENTKVFYIRTTKKSGLDEALRVMAEKTGEKDTAYIRRVITERLIADGYLTVKSVK